MLLTDGTVVLRRGFGRLRGRAVRRATRPARSEQSRRPPPRTAAGRGRLVPVDEGPVGLGVLSPPDARPTSTSATWGSPVTGQPAGHRLRRGDDHRWPPDDLRSPLEPTRGLSWSPAGSGLGSWRGGRGTRGRNRWVPATCGSSTSRRRARTWDRLEHRGSRRSTDGGATFDGGGEDLRCDERAGLRHAAGLPQSPATISRSASPAPATRSRRGARASRTRGRAASGTRWAAESQAPG